MSSAVVNSTRGRTRTAVRVVPVELLAALGEAARLGRAVPRPPSRDRAATPDERRLVDPEHDLVALVQHVVAEHDDAAVGVLGLALGEPLDLGADRVARPHRPEEPAVVYAEQREDGVAEEALGHRPAVGRGA